jgi:hypothetical protein
MIFTDQSRSCHPERSEGSLCPPSQTLRSAQGDKVSPARLGDWTHIQLFEERFQQVMVFGITQS